MINEKANGDFGIVSEMASLKKTKLFDFVVYE
jgi:hypothetical protein